MNPLDDLDLVAARVARDQGDTARAQIHFKLAAARENPVAVLELCELFYDLGDTKSVRACSAQLERLAANDAAAAFVAALAFQHGACTSLGDSKSAEAKHQLYLERSAELGLAEAQLELAASYAFGINGFGADPSKYAMWIHRAAQQQPEMAASLSARVRGVIDA